MSKKLGCCTMCDREVFESKERFSLDHPLQGQMCKVGAPHQEARRITLLLLNGSLVDLTFCASCDPSKNLSKLWAKICGQMVRELYTVYRIAIGAQPLTKEQHQKAEQNLIRTYQNPPIGVLYEQKWSEVSGCPN